MRRLIMLVSAVALGAVVAGCGASKPSAAAATGPAVLGAGVHKGPLRNVVYINPLPSSPLWDHYGQCIAAEGKAHGVSVREVRVGAENVDVQGLENASSQAVADHAQGIIAWDAARGPAFDPIWAREHQQGGVVGTMLSSGASREADFDVGSTPQQLAAAQIGAVASAPGQQRVGVIFSTATGSDSLAYLSALHADAASHANVTVVDVSFDENVFDNDQELADAMLRTHPDITALIVFDGSPGTVTAIRENHDIGKVYAYMSSEYHDAMLDYIKEGAVRLVFAGGECEEGRLAMDRLLDVWAGKQVLKQVVAPNGSFVTPAVFEHLLATGQE